VQRSCRRLAPLSPTNLTPSLFTPLLSPATGTSERAFHEQALARSFPLQGEAAQPLWGEVLASEARSKAKGLTGCEPTAGSP